MVDRVGSRREKIREEALQEIHDIARELLATGGYEAVTNAAIARAMGVSTPALYRYYGSHEELIAALMARLYREVTHRIIAARDEAGAAHPAARLLAMCRELRAWAIGFPAEFRLLFTSPSLSKLDEAAKAGTAFGDAFLDEVVAIWGRKPFPLPGPLSPALARQLRAYSRNTGNRLPPEAVHVFLTCWTRIYGVLSMEVLQQLDFALDDVAPFYERQLQDLCESLGVPYQAA